MSNTNRPDIRAYVGGTGSGKGASVREHLEKIKPRRLLIWDPLGEYAYCCKVVTGDMEVVARTIKAAKSYGESSALGGFSISFFPGPDARKFADNFEKFCRLAWWAGDADVLVEELADVTTASHAPPLWGRMVKQGRHRRLRLIGCTQRPASVDKDFLGNVTYVRVFCLNWPADVPVMAAVVRAPQADVAALLTTETDKETTIRFIERERATGKTTPGVKVLRRKG